jgi:hypothetical protein
MAGKGAPWSSTNQPTKNQRAGGYPKDLYDARKLTKARLEGLLNKHLWYTKDEAKSVVVDPETPMLEILIASIVNKAIVQGDEKRLNFILDRLIGKPEVEVKINDYMEKLKKLTDKEMIDAGAKAIKFLEDKGKKK